MPVETVLNKSELNIERRVRVAALEKAVEFVKEDSSSYGNTALDRAVARLHAVDNAEIWDNSGMETQYRIVDFS